MIGNHLEEIFDHFQQEYPREGCGVIGVVKGKSKWFPCKNVAEDDDDFVMDSRDYINASLRSDIVALVHSHPDHSPEPSEADIKVCNTLKLDSYIFSWPNPEMHHLEPSREEVPLFGREYEFGVFDCWKLVIDYYEKELGITLKRDVYQDNWWKHGLNYMDDLHKEYGFEEVTDGSLIKNALMFFNVKSKIPNHCGVYLGNDIFLHHSEDRLSCRERLHGSAWSRYKYKILRYKECTQ